MTEEHYEVEYVFGKSMIKETNYAVKWLGYDKKQHTWEPLSSFTQASIPLICRFEKLQAYNNYYKLILKKVEKVIPSKKPDEPIRIHIRNRYCQILIKEQEVINIELETDEIVQQKEAEKNNIINKYNNSSSINNSNAIINNYKQQNINNKLIIDDVYNDNLITIKDNDNDNNNNDNNNNNKNNNYDKTYPYRNNNSYYKNQYIQNNDNNDDDSDVQIVGYTISKSNDTKDLNRFNTQRVSKAIDPNRYYQLKSQQQSFFPIRSNGFKYKFKIEKDYLNEIIFEQRQREQDQSLIRNTISEIPKREIYFSIIHEEIQTEQIQTQQIVYRGQQFQYKVFNQKVEIELIQSHNMIKNELWFKCISEEEGVLYADLNTLQNYYTTLLLDYLQSFAVLL